MTTDDMKLKIERKKVTSEELFLGYKRDFRVEVLQGLVEESDEDSMEKVWIDFHAQKEENPAIDCAGDEIGVALPCEKEGFFSYFAGGKVKADAEINLAEGFDSYSIPVGEYVVCRFEAENFEALVTEALYKAQQYVYQVYLPKYEITTSSFCVERYARHDAKATQMELWLRIEE